MGLHNSGGSSPAFLQHFFRKNTNSRRSHGLSAGRWRRFADKAAARRAYARRAVTYFFCFPPLSGWDGQTDSATPYATTDTTVRRSLSLRQMRMTSAVAQALSARLTTQDSR